MDPLKQIKTYLNRHKKEMLSFLEQLVCVQSGTKNKAGVDQVSPIIKAEMEAMGFLCKTIKQEKLGNHLIARVNSHIKDQKQILMVGHMDTVFPIDTPFNYFKQDESKCYGPGVADMKGGLVVGIYALKALQSAGLMPDVPITFVFNSDEEIGSPGSRQIIQEEARQSQMAFVFEAGGLNNEVVTGRKGNISARLQIEGKAGHAAYAGKDKASAVLELAHKTIEIEKLNAPEKGISSNVGKVQGGIGPNTIAPHATARMDFRFLTSEEGKKLLSRIENICQSRSIPGTKPDLEIVSRRPAMPQNSLNKGLFDRLKKVASSLDMDIISELRQGVSDANLIAEEQIPVVDGLGPIGALDHSEKEYIITQSLIDRTVLFSGFLVGFRQTETD